MKSYVITGGNVFTGEDDQPFTSQKNIYIENGFITKMNDTIEPIEKGYEIINAKGMYVMPGLINLHVHLFGSGKPSKLLGGGGLQKQVLAFCKTKLGRRVLMKILQGNLESILHSGVTTVRSVGDFYYSDVEIRNLIQQNQIAGPRLYVSGSAITVPGGHGDGTFAITGTTPEQLKELVHINKKHQVDLIKICVTGGVMDAKKKGEPGEVKMNLTQTRAVCEEAHRLGYQVASHTESPEGVRIALEGGVDTIEHGSVLDEHTIELFQKHQASFICTLSPALPLASLPASKTKLNDLTHYNANIVLKNMIEGCKQAIEHHIPVGLGTDASCPYVTQYNMWRELSYFVKEIGVSNAFALHTATLVNAKILGIEDITGSITVGKSADILLLKENPIENLRALASIEQMLVRGSLIKQPHYKKNMEIEKELDSL